ncbi:MAG: DedA family protein [Anaerolineales bacterium]|nr:DedA family protein [Anaerolineales bacterium]
MIDQLETTILNALQFIYEELGWLGVTLVMVIENATGLTPSEVVLGFAGWMLIEAHNLPFSTVFLGGLFAAIGSVIGASLMYWAARLGGRPVVQRAAKIFRIDTRHIQRVEGMAEKYGVGFIFFGRLLPGIRTLVAIPAGLTGLSYPVFAAATFIGSYIWCTIFIGAGYFLGHEWHILSGIVKQAAPYALATAVLAGTGFLIWQLWMKKKAVPVKIEMD